MLEQRVEADRIQRCREIAVQHEIEPKDVELWKFQLSSMFDIFQVYCEEGEEDCRWMTVKESRISAAVRATGLIMKTRNNMERIPGLIKQELISEQEHAMEDHHGHHGVSGGISFKGFVRLLSELNTLESVYLRKVFDQNDANSSAGLSLTECHRALADCGLKPRTLVESEDINVLIEEFDEDGSGEVDPEEFLHLVTFVSEKVRVLRREEERNLTSHSDWTEDRLEKMREAFHNVDVDMKDNLDADGVARLLDKVLPLPERTESGGGKWTNQRVFDLLKATGFTLPRKKVQASLTPKAP